MSNARQPWASTFCSPPASKGRALARQRVHISLLIAAPGYQSPLAKQHCPVTRIPMNRLLGLSIGRRPSTYSVMNTTTVTKARKFAVWVR